MPLISVTVRGSNHPKLAINTDHIIGIQDCQTYRLILTSGSKADSSSNFHVEDSFDDVTNRFNEAVAPG